MSNKFRIILIVFISICASARGQDSSGIKAKLPVTPSYWLQKAQNSVMVAEESILDAVDTGSIRRPFERLKKDFDLIRMDFENQGKVMRIRTLDDVKAKLLQQKKSLDTWRNQTRRQNDALVTSFSEIEKIKGDSIRSAILADSMMSSIYAPEMQDLFNNVNRVETKYEQHLRQMVNIETELNKQYYVVNQLIIAVESELTQRSRALFSQTHPAIWELQPNSYRYGIGKVFMDTFTQTLASLKFYAENAYLRVILFRILLLVITLLPIWYFKKLKKTNPSIDHAGKFRFVHKYTGAATSSFVLVVAPFIFVNSPHIFTEVILATLAVTTTTIFLKENKELNKWYLISILAGYIILKAMNLMVTVTFFGRIVWALSIVLLYPVISFFRISFQSGKVINRYLFGFIGLTTILMMIAGWILSITGHFPLGRILILTGLDQFFLVIILYVAIYSFVDFVTVLADIYNSSNRVTVVRVDLIYNKLLTLVRILAVMLWFYTLALNLNAIEFLDQHFFSVFSQKITIGNSTFTPGSIVIFITTLLLSFYISGLLDGLFVDEKRSMNSAGKTSLGSIVLLLRLVIISLGFIGGMLIAGIPLNNMTLFVSALGVGLGFGLQSFIANMISGLIIAFEKPIYVGDIIEVENGGKGRVTDIGIRATKVDTADGAEYIIPNNELVSKVLKNWTLTSRYFKIEMNLLIAHNQDPGKVAEVIMNVLKETGFIMSFPGPKVQFTDVTLHGMQFQVSCWIANISESSTRKSELLIAITDALAKEGISFSKKMGGDD